MSSPLQRWNLRHLESSSHPPADPASFLVECFPMLPRPNPTSRALDLACGAGQNAIYLAERAWPVIAVDFSPAALDRAAALATSHQVCVTRRPSSKRFAGILLVEADLETYALPQSAFDLILCFQYLDRAAFPAIERALTPGGFLLYETFTVGAHPGVRPPSVTTDDQRAFHDGPRDPDHLLRPGELRSAFSTLETLFYREWTSSRAMASLLARKM